MVLFWVLDLTMLRLPQEMTHSSQTCPTCGARSSGKYCSECGSVLGGTPCPTCATSLTPGARFCHVCGTPLGKGKERNTNTIVPWAVAGTALVALVAVTAFFTYSPNPRDGGDPATFGGPSTRSTLRAPDISNMTPRERADRLFNRIMTAAERGDSAEIAFFKPMAIDAYALLGRLDNDARYHVALIFALTGDNEAALAHVDTLQGASPGHLFASVIRHTVAQNRGDDGDALSAYQEFLDNYKTQMDSGKTEYDEHGPMIDTFHERALQAIGRRSGT